MFTAILRPPISRIAPQQIGSRGVTRRSVDPIDRASPAGWMGGAMNSDSSVMDVHRVDLLYNTSPTQVSAVNDSPTGKRAGIFSLKDNFLYFTERIL
jgi:hypothetical protein